MGGDSKENISKMKKANSILENEKFISQNEIHIASDTNIFSKRLKEISNNMRKKNSKFYSQLIQNMNIKKQDYYLTKKKTKKDIGSKLKETKKKLENLFSKNESKKNENSKTDDDSEKMSIEKFVDLKLKNMKVTNFLLEPKNILKVLNDLGDYLIQLMVYLKKKSESKKFQIFDNISKKLITPSNKINFVFLQHFFKNESILVLKKLCLFFCFLI